MCCGCSCKPDLGLLPMLTGIIMGVGILTTYSIAVGLGHVSPLLPSISDTGIMSPEMHIFSQVLNVVAALSFLTFVLRYKMIHSLVDEEDSARLRTLTRINLVTGCIASFGLSIVGNFQDNTAFRLHMTGAFMVFLFGNFYCIIDAVIAFKMYPNYHNSRLLFWIRLSIGILGFLLFITAMTSFILAHEDANGKTFSKQHWSKTNPGYKAHLVYTFAEWIMGFVFISYFFTHVKDFGRFLAALKVQPKQQPLNVVAEHYEEIVERGHNHTPNERTGLM